jgi:hypothetical protein
VIVIVPLLALAVTIGISQPAAAQQNVQSLNKKLQQKEQFRPTPGTPLEQLIEVAKTFDIPMGIEWTESAKCNASPNGFQIEETVGELLKTIVRRCPAQTLTVEHGIVHVHSRFVRHPYNILNLRVWRFQIKDGSAYDAQYELRLAIDMQLHPKKYAGGYNGGHGSPRDNYPDLEAGPTKGYTVAAGQCCLLSKATRRWPYDVLVWDFRRHVTVRSFCVSTLQSGGRCLPLTGVLTQVQELPRIGRSPCERRRWVFLTDQVQRN